MALLENLRVGSIYLIKLAASNDVGEGPFSSMVELAVLPKEPSEANQRPKRLDSAEADTSEPLAQPACVTQSLCPLGTMPLLSLLEWAAWHIVGWAFLLWVSHRGPWDRNACFLVAARSGSYQLDQRSMTGIIAGVSIALVCILLCILILIYRGKAR